MHLNQEERKAHLLCVWLSLCNRGCMLYREMEENRCLISLTDVQVRSERERDRDADNLSRLIYFSVSFRQLSRQQQLKRGENVDKRKEKAEKKYN